MRVHGGDNYISVARILPSYVKPSTSCASKALLSKLCQDIDGLRQDRNNTATTGDEAIAVSKAKKKATATICLRINVIRFANIISDCVERDAGQTGYKP